MEYMQVLGENGRRENSRKPQKESSKYIKYYRILNMWRKREKRRVVKERVQFRSQRKF